MLCYDFNFESKIVYILLNHFIYAFLLQYKY